METKDKPKEKKKAIKQVLELNEIPVNQVRVGEIFLSSPNLEMVDLCSLVLQLLEKESIEKYLGTINSKKQLGTYTG